MSTSSFGYTNTSTASLKSTSVLPDLAIANSYAVKSLGKDEVILTNTTAPVDQPETFRVASQRVANIYNNSGIDPQYYTASKYGRSIVIGCDSVGKYSVTQGSTQLDKLFPLKCHLVISAPENANCDKEDILKAVQRLEAFIHAYAKDSTNLTETDAFIQRMFQGALVHPEV